MSKAQALLHWIDERFPLTALWKSQVSEYYAPKNFNFWYYFGSLALLVLVIQIVSGIFLTMNYKPDAHQAFQSVEYIMRDVQGGWFIRYMHSTGASMFFIVVYLHMFRGLMYGSYRKPRELLWLVGVLIYLCMMAEAFFGYLLPWGQMSYWGAQVIVNLFGAIPIIGDDLAVWIRGDYVVSDATLNRFFAFHVIAIPLVLLALVVVHLMALHEVGSNNPDGIEIKKNIDPGTGHPLDGIPFHPYYTIKDMVGVVVFLAVFSFIMFFAPEMGGYFLEYNNFIPAESAADAAPYRPGLVLHALLRHAACGPCLPPHPVLGGARDGSSCVDLLPPTLARPQPGEIDPVQGAVFQVCARHVCDQLPGLRLARHTSRPTSWAASARQKWR